MTDDAKKLVKRLLDYYHLGRPHYGYKKDQFTDAWDKCEEIKEEVFTELEKEIEHE